MALSWAFFALSIVWVVSTQNALRPPKAGWLSVPAFFAGWFVSELPILNLVAQAVAAGLFIWGGALQAWPGIVGLALAACSWVGLVVLEASSLVSWKHIDRTLASIETDTEISVGISSKETAESVTTAASAVQPASRFRPSVPFFEARLPFPRRGRTVEKIHNVDYWGDGIHPHRLDIYRPHGAGTKDAPVMVYIHGGAWVLGDKREQGRPMMYHLARRGWVCATVNYRLSPRATWPDAIIDCMKAMAWVKENIASYGGDPRHVVVSGGSAGGHLAALVALASGDPEFQPGFEDANTSVVACVPFYGVYDFTNGGHVFDRRFVSFLERLVFKATVAEKRELFEKASPYFRVHTDAPPFLVINGRNDTLVPVGEPRRFVEKLRDTSKNPVCYIELPVAQHAFEIFPSVRSCYAVRAVDRFFAAVQAPRTAPATSG